MQGAHPVPLKTIAGGGGVEVGSGHGAIETPAAATGDVGSKVRHGGTIGGSDRERQSTGEVALAWRHWAQLQFRYPASGQ